VSVIKVDRLANCTADTENIFIFLNHIYVSFVCILIDPVYGGKSVMDIALIVIISVLVLYFLAMIPLQYNYIKEMQENKAKTQKANEEIIDNMSFENQQLTYNMQGYLFTLPSSIVAWVIYKIRHRTA